MSISAKKSAKTAHQENLPKNIDQENQRKTPRKYQYTVHEENLPNQPPRNPQKPHASDIRQKTSTKQIRQNLSPRKPPNTPRNMLKTPRKIHHNHAPQKIHRRNPIPRPSIHHHGTFTLGILSHHQKNRRSKHNYYI
jgi:hypothetical protein